MNILAFLTLLLSMFSTYSSTLDVRALSTDIGVVGDPGDIPMNDCCTSPPSTDPPPPKG